MSHQFFKIRYFHTLIILFFALVLSPSRLAAQVPEIVKSKKIPMNLVFEKFFYQNQWGRNLQGAYYDEVVDFIELDNGYILGLKSSTIDNILKINPIFGDYDYWVIRIDFSGNIIWEKTFGGNYSDVLVKLKKLLDGNILLIGDSYSNSSGSKSENQRWSSDFWVVKIDQNGNQLWDKTIGSLGVDNVSDCLELPDQNLIFFGTTNLTQNGYERNSIGYGGSDFWLVKTNNFGQYLTDFRFGGDNDDYLNNAIFGNENNILMVGISYSGQSGIKTTDTYGAGDIWMLSIDYNFNIIWQKNFGGNSFETGRRILKANNCYYIGGVSSTNINGSKTSPRYGDVDFWLIKIDNQGNQIWDRTCGGTSEEFISDMTINPLEEVYITGFTRSGRSGNLSSGRITSTNDVLVAKFDSKGNILFDKRLDGYFRSNCWNNTKRILFNHENKIFAFGDYCEMGLMQIWTEYDPIDSDFFCKNDSIYLSIKNCNQQVSWENLGNSSIVLFKPAIPAIINANCGPIQLNAQINLFENEIFLTNSIIDTAVNAKYRIVSPSNLTTPTTFISNHIIELLPGFNSNSNLFEARIKDICINSN
ncbi:MAG: hypothetical protein IPH28_24105 [Cytophagaceae bacterium]|nr:hypothetical protein [Cytophagaceae bacterium]MBK9508026.1 hypothetical protein [Cytophagaceae bacterium]MBK9936434.1 hypothetical protein [Cytophagaceae bacterium]MBL0300184.1 hypothetical protein [Cytophagaceae bacterium]MBL0327120.1 hypothetical protein [Cytophagaceae bacterium]